MSGEDELRRRLRDADPARPGGPRSSQQSPTAHDILERAMRTADRHDTGSTPTPTPTSTPTGTPTGTDGRRWRRRPLLVAGLAAAGAAVVASGLALSSATGGDDGPAPATVALTAAPADATASCPVFDLAVLAQAPTALAGTVTAVDAGTTTVQVDRWYRGGPGDVVTVTSERGRVALDGLELLAGEEYLLTAGADGVVSGCGLSGPATPQLREAFEQAFGR